MWFIAAGLAISVVGWIVLIVGASIEPSSSSLFARADSNAHLLAIASNVIYLGYAVCIFGAIWELPHRIRSSRSDSTADEETEEPVAVTPYEARVVDGSGPRKSAVTQMPVEVPETTTDGWAQVKSEFERHFGVKVRVHANGRIILAKDAREYSFENVDQAWDFCLKHLYVQPAVSDLRQRT